MIRTRLLLTLGLTLAVTGLALGTIAFIWLVTNSELGAYVYDVESQFYKKVAAARLGLNGGMVGVILGLGVVVYTLLDSRRRGTIQEATRRVVVVSTCTVIAAILIANLAVLLLLSPTVAAEGLPKDLDQYTGVEHSFSVIFYGQLATAGFFLVLPLTAAMLILGVSARRSEPGWFRAFGSTTVGAAVVLLITTPWAGYLWAGYGW